MHKKLVLGAITNYTYHDVEPWLVSLKKTGYDGDIGLIVYNMKAEEVKKLEDKGVTIFAQSRDETGNLTYPEHPNFSIMVERFIHTWYFLGNLSEEEKPDYVLLTDVKDVIFQVDPIDEDHDYLLNVAHENMTYENEPWSANNMKNAFGPLMYEAMRNRPIICAGVIGGHIGLIRDLCLQIYLMCRGTPSRVMGGGGPDQAALNILLSSEVWQYVLNLDEFPSIVHMGTTTLAIKAGSGDIGYDHVKNGTDFSDKFIEEDHVVIEDGVVVSDYDAPYAIVHQWNRVPELVTIVNRKYRE